MSNIPYIIEIFRFNMIGYASIDLLDGIEEDSLLVR
jgi:hypothetical protein